MPEIIAIAGRSVPGLDARMVQGADEVPDVQRAFPVSRIAGELGPVLI
jgi:hypothetical protein